MKNIFYFAALFHSSIALATMSPTQEFFYGRDVRVSDLIELQQQDHAELGEKIEKKLGEFGIQAMNLKQHGISRSEYVRRMGRSSVSVLHVQVSAIRPIIAGRFLFDFAYARGTAYFIEDNRAFLVKDCRGRIRSNGAVEVQLDRCLDSHENNPPLDLFDAPGK